MSEHSDSVHEGHEAHESHAVPLRVLVTIFVALLVLTWATVAITWLELGEWSLIAALAIAVVKGSLVGLYFMHLRYDAPFNGVILITALIFVGLFIGGVLTDSFQYAETFKLPRIVETTQN
jgi:cytochrome c oxidase subunit 4